MAFLTNQQIYETLFYHNCTIIVVFAAVEKGLKVSIKSSGLRFAGKKIEAFPLEKRIRFEKLIDAFFIWRTLKDEIRRRKLMRSDVKPLFQVKKDEGYSKINLDNFDSSIFIDYASQARNQYKLGGEFKQKNKKEYLQQIANLENISSNNEIMKFALSDSTLKAVSEYLGKFPILHDISVFYSPPSEVNLHNDEYRGSQLFHRDGGGTRCLKLWILCEKVSFENGPTTLLPVDISDSVCNKLRYVTGKKFESDEPLSDVLHHAVSLVGEVGDCFATDTDRCLHYGSRTKKESSRLVMMFHYVDRNSVYYLPFITKHYFKKYKKIDREKLELSELSREAIRFR